MIYSPFLSCRQASRLITAELDRELTSLESVTLRLHLCICDVCPTVIRQFALLRRSMVQLREVVDVEPVP